MKKRKAKRKKIVRSPPKLKAEKGATWKGRILRYRQRGYDAARIERLMNFYLLVHGETSRFEIEEIMTEAEEKDMATKKTSGKKTTRKTRSKKTTVPAAQDATTSIDVTAPENAEPMEPAKKTAKKKKVATKQEPFTDEFIPAGLEKEPKTPKASKAKSTKKTDGKMSLIDAAFAVMSKSKKSWKLPEVVEKVLELGLAETKGATPVATLSSSIGRDIAKGATRFVRTGPGMYAASKE